MKKSKLLVLPLMLTLTLTACTKKDVATDTDTIFKVADSEDSFVVEQDNYASQPYWSRSESIVKLNDGYYINNGYLKYFDTDTNEQIYLCSKPDCEHYGAREWECNSNIDSNFNQRIYSYKDKLYLFRRTGNDIYLIEHTTDGSGEYKELFKVGECFDKVDRDDFASWGMVFMEDDVYVFTYYPYFEEAEVTITRYSLSTGKGEVITSNEFTGEYLWLSCVRGYGNKLFYCMQTLDVDNFGATDENKSGVFVYDSETKNTIQLFRGESVRSFSVNEEANEIYYYSTGVGLKKAKLDKLGEEATLIVKADTTSQFVDMSFDGKYIYTDNTIWNNWTGHACGYYLNIYDINGEKINSFELDAFEDIEWGDDKYLWINNECVSKENIANMTKEDLPLPDYSTWTPIGN